MKHNVKSRPDYVAEVSLPYDKLTYSFSETLKEHGLQTKRVGNTADEFLSEATEHSFRKTVLGFRPSRIKWRVEQLSAAQSRIIIFFGIPMWLNVRFCFMFILFICFTSGGYLALLKPIDTTVTYFIVACFLLCGGCSTFFLLLFLYLRLLRRHVILGKQLLLKACESRCCGSSGVHPKSVPIKARAIMGWKVMIAAMCMFSFPVFVPPYDFIQGFIKSRFMVIFLLFITILVFFYFSSYGTKKRYSLRTKVTIVLSNFVVAFFVGFMLLALPVLTYLRSKDAIEFLSMATTESFQASKRPLETVTLSDILAPSLTLAQVRLIGVKMIFEQLLLWFFAVTVLVVTLEESLLQVYGFPTIDNRYLVDIFHTETKSSKKHRKISLQLPLMTKIGIMLIFFMSFAACWAGVLMHISVLNRLIVPSLRFTPLWLGETITRGTMLMAGAILGEFGVTSSVCLIRLLLITPAILPFLLLVFLSLRVVLVSRLQKRSLVPLTGNVVATTYDITAKVGIQKVLCLFDPQSTRLSTYAEARGWFPRKRIVFSKTAMAFFTEHPEHAEAILAHEVAHLKFDCSMLWRLKLTSRLSLVPVGFLSVMIDSVRMEDRADNFAVRYLQEKGKDQSLLREAASMMEARYCLNNQLCQRNQLVSAPFLPIPYPEQSIASDIKETFLKDIVTALLVAHNIYFYTELYGYIHREAKYR